MAHSEYLCLKRGLRPKQPEEHPPEQVEQILHPAFIARFGPSGQANGICDSDTAFKRIGLPYVTPHSARHSFISTLQAQGIEVGLVAKVAGHANPTVTLGHYTQAVRGGAAAAVALEAAYAAG